MYLLPDDLRGARHRSQEVYGLPKVDPRAKTELDEITRLARVYSGWDGASVNVVQHGVQQSPSTSPVLEVTEIPETWSFCAHFLDAGTVEPVMVPDLAHDPRFFDNPLVNGHLGSIASYAAAPLLARHRVAVGTLCVWSMTPASLTDDQLSLLGQLGRAVVKVLDEHVRAPQPAVPFARPVTPARGVDAATSPRRFGPSRVADPLSSPVA